MVLVEPRNQARRTGAVSIVIGAELRMQQSLLRADAREEWRNSERREQHANRGTKGKAPAQRANEQPQIAGVTDDTVDTAVTKLWPG